MSCYGRLPPYSYVFTPYMAFAQTTAVAPLADQSQQQLLSAGQLDALVAPIALYPDALPSAILMASTDPLEGGRGRSLGWLQQEP